MKSPLVLLQQTSCDWEVPTDSPATPPPIHTAPGALSETLLKWESRSHEPEELHRHSFCQKQTSPFWKGTPMWWLIAGSSSYFQLCWLYRAATLLSKCDGHWVLGELDVIPADKDTNRLCFSYAIWRCIEQRSKWSECSKLTANRERKLMWHTAVFSLSMQLQALKVPLSISFLR